MTGSSAALEGLSTLIPLGALGAPSLGRSHTQVKPKSFHAHAAACLPGALLPTALGYMYFFNLAELSAASSRFQLFLSVSHPAWLLSSKCWGQNTPPRGASGLPRGAATARLNHPAQRPLAAGRTAPRRLLRAQPLLYNPFPAAINNLGESHFKGKGWRPRGALGTERDRGVAPPDPTPALCINK